MLDTLWLTANKGSSQGLQLGAVVRSDDSVKETLYKTNTTSLCVGALPTLFWVSLKNAKTHLFLKISTEKAYLGNREKSLSFIVVPTGRS